ncbi:MAG: hypothetical protein ACOX32_04300 [Bacteroidaceae bacterium]|jgi:hypothetical protein
MKKSLKLFLAGAIVAVSFGVAGLFSTNKVVCGNIEALTSGESFEFEYYQAYQGINDEEYQIRRIRAKSEGFCSIAPCTEDEDGTCWEIVVMP